MKHESVYGSYFMGNEVSDYGKKCGHVDYRTFAKAFDAVLNNDIINKTSEIGYWEIENGTEEYYEDRDGNRYDYDEAQEKIEELEEKQLEVEADSDEYAELQAEIDELNDAHYEDVFQYYIVSDEGARIIKDWTDELLWYNEELDMYVWGVTHYGTSWDYVLTDIRCNASEEDEEEDEEENN